MSNGAAQVRSRVGQNAFVDVLTMMDDLSDQTRHTSQSVLSNGD
ncbi:hypothetical protein [Fibrella forsythiae]|nr:hypothetical protein [Fibrella forsythiae]